MPETLKQRISDQNEADGVATSPTLPLSPAGQHRIERRSHFLSVHSIGAGTVDRMKKRSIVRSGVVGISNRVRRTVAFGTGLRRNLGVHRDRRQRRTVEKINRTDLSRDFCMYVVSKIGTGVVQRYFVKNFQYTVLCIEYS